MGWVDRLVGCQCSILAQTHTLYPTLKKSYYTLDWRPGRESPRELVSQTDALIFLKVVLLVGQRFFDVYNLFKCQDK